MYKFIIYPMLFCILLYAYMDQLSNQSSFIHYYKMKYALNRATHAGALQLDEERLSDGIIYIDELKAYDAAIKILNDNIGTTNYELLLFEVVQLQAQSRPYHYINSLYNIDILIYEPAVIIVIETSIPHLIKVKRRYTWKIYGTSEVVNSFN